MTMNQGTVESPFGPKIQALMALVGAAGGIYLEADKYRKARISGVEVAPQAPLDSLLSQSGMHVPTMEAMLAKMMGDTPDAKKVAATIANNRDAGTLLQEFARFTEQKAREGGASTSSASPGAEPSSTSAPPNGTTPSSSAPPPGAASATAESPPPPTQAPPADRGPVFHPPHTHRPTGPQASAGSPPLYRADYADGGGLPPLYRADYAEPAASGSGPSPRSHGAPHSPGAESPPRARVPSPPTVRSSTAGRPTTPTNEVTTSAAPSQRLTRRPPSSTMPTRRTSTARPPASPATPTAPASSTEPAPATASAPATDAPSPAAKSSTGEAAPRSFLDWLKDRLTRIERQREADLADLRRIIEVGCERVEKIEVVVDRLEAARRGATEAPADSTPSATTPREAAQTTEKPAGEAGLESTDAPTDLDAIEAIEVTGVEVNTAAEPVDPATTSSTTTASGAASSSPTTATTTKPPPLDGPDDIEPPPATLEDMVEATHLVMLHQQRMRDLDCDARRQHEDHARRLTRTEDRCTALALVAPAGDQTP